MGKVCRRHCLQGQYCDERVDGITEPGTLWHQELSINEVSAQSSAGGSSVNRLRILNRKADAFPLCLEVYKFRTYGAVERGVFTVMFECNNIIGGHGKSSDARRWQWRCGAQKLRASDANGLEAANHGTLRNVEAQLDPIGQQAAMGANIPESATSVGVQPQACSGIPDQRKELLQGNLGHQPLH